MAGISSGNLNYDLLKSGVSKAKEFGSEIKNNIKVEEIINTQIRTMQEVNSNLIMLYFKLGKIVSENKQY